MASPALPFCTLRWSSANSVDVKKSPSSSEWFGLAGVEGVSIEELIRQAKSAFPETYKSGLLVNLPRLLMWTGSSVPKEGADGGACFVEGQKLTCELEDPSSGEIDDAIVECSEANYAAAEQEASAAEHEEFMRNAAQSAPRVGLDAMMGEQQRSRGSAGTQETEDDWEGEDEDEEDEEDNNGMGVDAEPPAELKVQVLASHLQSIVANAIMLGLPPHDILECFVEAGGLMVEPQESAGGAGHPGMPGGMPGGAQAGCPQQ